MLEEIIQLEGAQTIAAFFLETVSGTNGILIPPDGYLQGVRELCTKHGILMVCDEVMAGFGRTGEWFAVNHWNVVPDIITMAKGLTSAYVPLGAVGMRRADRRSLQRQGVPGRSDLQQPPAGVRGGAGDAARLRGGRPDREREAHGTRHDGAARPISRAKHPIVGAHRNIGLFGIVELVEGPANQGAARSIRRHLGPR